MGSYTWIFPIISGPLWWVIDCWFFLREFHVFLLISLPLDFRHVESQFLAVSTNYDLYVVKSTIYPWSHTSHPHLFVFCDASIFAGLSPLVWWSTPGLDGGFNHSFWMVKTHFLMANYYFLGFAEGTTEHITDLPWIDSPSSGFSTGK